MQEKRETLHTNKGEVLLGFKTTARDVLLTLCLVNGLMNY